jgi:hypothetical protein
MTPAGNSAMEKDTAVLWDLFTGRKTFAAT